MSEPQGMPDAWMLGILKKASQKWLATKSKLLHACGIRKDPRMALNQREAVKVMNCLTRVQHDLDAERKGKQ